MPWIAHRRRGSKFGHHSFWFALVSPPLLPLALSTSSLRPSLVKSTHAFELSNNSAGTYGDTTVPRRKLLSSFHRCASASMLTAGPSLCL